MSDSYQHEMLLAQHYDLDLAIPTSIASSIKAPQQKNDLAPSHSIQLSSASSLQEKCQSFTDVETSGINLLCNQSISYARRERIAMAILTGTYDKSIGELRALPSQVSAFESESAILSDIVYGPIRGELQGPNFLELSCSAVSVDLRSPRRAYEEKRPRLKELNNEAKEVNKTLYFKRDTPASFQDCWSYEFDRISQYLLNSLHKIKISKYV